MIIFILHLISCAFMAGLIWAIQILHYPAFDEIHPDKFITFHTGHSNKITYIVGPVMGLELITAIILLIQKVDPLFFAANLLFLGLIWFATAFLSVPLHNTLSKGQNNLAIKKLVNTNWPRTILWSLRLVILTIYFLNSRGL